MCRKLQDGSVFRGLCTNEHLSNLYAQSEIVKVSTIRNFRTVQKEGEREVARTVDFYNLDASWKKFTGMRICAFRKETISGNASLLSGDETKHVWHRDYWDRFIRDEDHFRQTIEYIHLNPVKAKLVEKAETSATHIDLAVNAAAVLFYLTESRIIEATNKSIK